MSLELGPSPDLNLGPHTVSPHRGWGWVGQWSRSLSLRELLPSLFLRFSHAHSRASVHTRNGSLYLNFLVPIGLLQLMFQQFTQVVKK